MSGMTPIERAGCIAHSMTKGYQAKLAKTKALIASHPDYAVSASWGKDSCVMLHLAAQVHKDLLAVNGRFKNPNERVDDSDKVRDAMLARDDMFHVNYHEIEVMGEWEMFEMAGEAFTTPITDAHKKAFKAWQDDFTTKMTEAVTSRGCVGTFVGLRQEESNNRRMNIAMRGDDYTKADGSKICLPIARWSGLDIWAYIVTHELPYLPFYDNSILGRERARSEFIFGSTIANTAKRHGVWEDWKLNYPKEFNAWMTRFPELQKV